MFLVEIVCGVGAFLALIAAVVIVACAR